MANRIETGFEIARTALEKMNPVRAVKHAIWETKRRAFRRALASAVQESYEKLSPEAQLRTDIQMLEFNLRVLAQSHREGVERLSEKAAAEEAEATRWGDELTSRGWPKLTS